MRKYINILLFIIVSLCLTACVKIESNYHIYNDGEYSYTFDILLPAKIYESDTLDIDIYKEQFIKEFNLENDKVKELDRIIDGVNYKGFSIHKSKGPSNNSETINIQTNSDKDEIVTKINNIISNDLWFSIGEFSSNTSLKDLKEDGLSIILRVHMPGNITYASNGIVEKDVVTFDLIDNTMEDLIIRSKINHHLFTKILIIILSIILLFSISLFILNKYYPKYTKPIIKIINTKLDYLKKYFIIIKTIINNHIKK